MKSSDVRRLCIKRQMRVHFVLPNGKECSIDEHGATQCTGGDAFTGGGLPEIFSRIQHFRLEAGAGPGMMTVSRRELEELAEELEAGVRG